MPQSASAVGDSLLVPSSSSSVAAVAAAGPMTSAATSTHATSSRAHEGEGGASRRSHTNWIALDAKSLSRSELEEKVCHFQFIISY
jgi:mevalonate pyrophosphate decarboxylase